MIAASTAIRKSVIKPCESFADDACPVPAPSPLIRLTSAAHDQIIAQLVEIEDQLSQHIDVCDADEFCHRLPAKMIDLRAAIREYLSK